MAARKIKINILPECYNPVYIPYLTQSRPTEIFFGGSSSGKSFFIAQRAVEDILIGGHNYLVCRKNANSINKSIFNEIQKAIFRLKVPSLFDLVPSRSVITCKNGYQILFAGLDDVEKVKSITPQKGVITDIMIEEATETVQDDIRQLEKRLRGFAQYKGQEISKRLIMMFNPIYKTHWIYQTYFKNWKDGQKQYLDDNLSILKTTHLDNEFLTQADHDRLENEPDEYWRNVYTFGNWGILGDAIFTNWHTEDLSGIKNSFDRIRNGLDFGYSQDPNSFVRIHYDKKYKKIYIFDGWEARGMTNPMIADRLKLIIGHEAIFCDSSEPKSIDELQSEGIDARPVKKGKDSILHGIKWLNKHEIIIDSSLQHIINEFNTYQWKKDKNGNSLPIPVDRDNHSVDATRYATEVEHSGFFEGLI